MPRRRRTRPGGRARSCTRCTRARSRTPTATASGTSRITRRLDHLERLGSTSWAVPGVPVAAGGQRLRHQRLRGRRPAVRVARRPRRPDRGAARARDEARHGPRRQPHERRAPVVRRVALVRAEPAARLVLVAPRARGHGAGRPGRRADELALVLRGQRVAVRRGLGRVLPAPVRHQAAGPQLGEPRRPRGGLRDDAAVARPRRRRLPHGRHQPRLQGRRARRLAARRRGALGHLRGREPALHGRAARARVPRRDAPRGVRALPRPRPGDPHGGETPG